MKPYFPYSDLQTRNLVLQVMEYEGHDIGRSRRNYLASSLEELTDDPEVARKKPSTDVGAKVKAILEKKGKAFLHTPEYYAAIEDEHEKMKAYRSLVLSTSVPQGEDAEIAKNPFKYLGLPEDATFGQTRAAWIRLSKIWFPDLMVPENTVQYRRIFGNEKFIIEGTDYDSWREKFLKANRPEAHRASQLKALNPQELEEYRQKHEVYRAIELEYKRVKAEMSIRATKKIQIINRAYDEARKRFSSADQETFAGFEWINGRRGSPLDDVYSDFKGLEYRSMDLEGNGQIRRDFGRHAFDGFAYLAFDFGEIYLEDNDFRQRIYLKPFFAWTELVTGRELSPTLLDDMVSQYKLNHDQWEQLRLMMMNRETPNFIVTALGISRKDFHHMGLIHFLQEAYECPEFYHAVGPLDAEHFGMGVELTPRGELILTYKSQMDVLSGFALDAQAHFTPIDVQMMMAIAYGSMLPAPK